MRPPIEAACRYVARPQQSKKLVMAILHAHERLRLTVNKTAPTSGARGWRLRSGLRSQWGPRAALIFITVADFRILIFCKRNWPTYGKSLSYVLRFAPHIKILAELGGLLPPSCADLLACAVRTADIS